jgi:hypothetical protein
MVRGTATAEATAAVENCGIWHKEGNGVVVARSGARSNLDELGRGWVLEFRC